MNKSHELKHTHQYQSGQLRERILASMKKIRDEEDEGRIPKQEDTFIIPVTGKSMQKYFENKVGKIR